MTRAQSKAYKLRWLILIAGVLCILVGIWGLFGAPLLYSNDAFPGVVGTPATFWWLEDIFPSSTGFYINATFSLGLFLVMQWLFLRPRRGWAPMLTTVGRPMRSSLIAAASMAMLLTTGLAATLLEIPDWWPVLETMPGLLAWWTAMAVMWAAWSVVFFIYWRQGDRYTQLGKMIRGLVAGSILESIVATAVFAWNPHNESCYCARGSYTGLVFGGTVLLWCFGPGIILLFMRERYRRERLLHTQLCPNCDYNLRGTIAAGRSECPECGAVISTEVTQDGADAQL